MLHIRMNRVENEVFSCGAEQRVFISRGEGAICSYLADLSSQCDISLMRHALLFIQLYSVTCVTRLMQVCNKTS